MSPKRTQEKRAEPAKVAIETEASDRQEKIRVRAYELYIARGEGPGDEMEDWLQAERELAGG